MFLPYFFTDPILAQEETTIEENPLVITGSVDTYYKYDLSGYQNNDGGSNIQTSFANEQNSLSIGMIDIGIAKTIGKASFVGEISFGPRGQTQSIPDEAAGGSSFNIQNLYVAYAFTDKLSLTGGYMGTFVGYEVISPTGNFNYSTSHLFTYGPFQNAGIKLDYAVSDRFSFMVGLFNDWNTYTDFDGVSNFGAQLHVVPVEGWDLYANVLTGRTAYGYGTELDLSTGYQITEDFYLGLNAANLSVNDNDEFGGFSGAALYAQYALSESFALGFRGEQFAFKDGKAAGTVITPGYSITSFTVSGNLVSGPLTFIPEVRLDAGSEDIFLNSNDAATSTATQVLLAVVYAF